jgi:hypothetical protein
MDNLTVFLLILLGIILLPPALIAWRLKNWKKGVISALSGIVAAIVVILLFGLISSAGDSFGWRWTSGPGLGIFVVVFIVPCGYILGLSLPFIVLNSWGKRNHSNSETINKFCSSCGKPILRRESSSKMAFCPHCGANLSDVSF